MIKSKDLDNRAEGLRGQDAAEAALARAKAGAPVNDEEELKALKARLEAALARDAEQELAALKAKIDAARHLPPPKDVDGRAWALGRNAAIEAIVGP